MSKKQTDQESENPEGLDEFTQLVKRIFTMSPEETKELLDREKREGIPPDPDEEKETSN